MTTPRGGRWRLEDPDCPPLLNLEQVAAALSMPRPYVRRYEASDPTFPKRQKPIWNPGGHGKFRRDELRRWVAGTSELTS